MAILLAGNEDDTITGNGYFDTTANIATTQGHQTAAGTQGHLNLRGLWRTAVSGPQLSNIWNVALPSPQTDFWFQFVISGHAVGEGGGAHLFRALGPTGQQLVVIYVVDRWALGTLLHIGGTSYTQIGPYVAFNNNKTTVTVRLRLHDTNGLIEYYLNGSRVFQYTGDTIRSTDTTITHVAGDNLGSYWAGATTYVSQMLATTADESPIGMTVATLAPSTAGAVQQWTGTVADISEAPISTATAILAGSPDLVSTFQVGDVGTAALVRAVVVTTVARVGSTLAGPQNLHGVVRIGGTNYTTAAVTLDSVARPRFLVFEQNPATAASWTPDAINGAELGLQSAA